MEYADVRERFVGRGEELAQFRQWLLNPDPQAPRLLYLYDKLEDPDKKGGVGKTWLLRAFVDIAKELYPQIVAVSIDFFNITDRDGAVVAERVAQALKEAYPDWDTSRFESALLKYNNALREGETETTDYRHRIAEALSQDLHALDAQLSTAGKHLLILFDTYELIQENPFTALLRLDRAFPDDYGFARLAMVIAGRYALDWRHPNWRGREREVETMPIAPFTLDETVKYFEKLANVDLSGDASEIQALHDLTEGRPILISLANDLLGQYVLTREGQHLMTLKDLVSIPKREFEASLVAKINDLPLPIGPIILFMSHVYHRFNFALLDFLLKEVGFSDLLQDTNTEEVAQQLLRLSFVRRPSSGEDFVLHDEMRPLIDRHCWKFDRNRERRKLLSQCASEYYEAELQRIEAAHPQDASSEQLRQAYIAELLYHKLYVDLDDGYAYFTKHFSIAVYLLLSSFGRALLREAKQFEKEMSPTQRSDLKFSEAKLLRKEEDAERALKLFLELEQEAEPAWLDEHQADLLFEKGVAYQRLSRYTEAINCFIQAGEMKKRQGDMLYYAGTLNWLGSVYQKQGQLDIALSYYEECLKIRQEAGDKRACAAVLVNISDVYRLQGKVERALRAAKTSQRIRRDLFDQGQVGEVSLGWSRVTIGLAHYQNNDFLEAEEAFQEALDIFRRAERRRGLATVYNCLGKLSMDQDAFYYARQWFNDAYTMALGIDLEQQINSLTNQGRLLMREKQYQQALEFFQQAATLAKEARSEYQQAEALVYLAGTLKRVGRDEESRKARQEADRISQKYQYYYLLGLASTLEGDAFYDTRNYREAFRNYGQACAAMARYNNSEYQETLSEMGDALSNIPAGEIGPIADELIAYWSAQRLERRHPDFISTCREIKSLLGE